METTLTGTGLQLGVQVLSGKVCHPEMKVEEKGHPCFLILTGGEMGLHHILVVAAERDHQHPECMSLLHQSDRPAVKPIKVMFLELTTDTIGLSKVEQGNLTIGMREGKTAMLKLTDLRDKVMLTIMLIFLRKFIMI